MTASLISSDTSCCSCLAFLKKPFAATLGLSLSSLPSLSTSHELDRQDFEEIVAFLGSVPLFKNQLPRSELPKLARALRRNAYHPGNALVTEGETGRAFHLIQSGEANVMTSGGGGQQIRAILKRGDHFGGQTLTEERPNIATITAAGPESLITLSMSRASFDEFGIRKWLKFPKRPALYAKQASADLDDLATCSKAPEEESFICAALRNNANLRALLKATEDQLEAVAAAAERRVVEKGELVARCGDVGDKFFIIRSGSFDIVVGRTLPEENQHLSAEAAVASSTMAERLLRKQNFLQTLSQPSLAARGRATSTFHQPRETQVSDFFARQTSTPGESSSQAPAVLKRSFKQPRQGRQEGNTLRPFQGQGELETCAENSPRADMVLREGDSFGELSLLYNMRREASFQARENAVVYVVHRQHWESCFSRRGQRFQEYCELLDEVECLQPLVSSERWELACNATGLVHFAPGERVLTQGKVRQARQWYVIFSGSCLMVWDKPGAKSLKLAEVYRPGCFGERSLLRGDVAYDVNVDAGENGMTCLTFNGETSLLLLKRIYEETDGHIPNVHADIENWCKQKGLGSGLGPVSPVHVTEKTPGGSRSNRSVTLKDLSKICVLGRGGFGEVYLVEHTKRNRRYAMKVMSKGHILRMDVERQIRWEQELLSMIDSSFVIHLYKSFSNEQHIFFLLEPVLGGNLLELLHKNPEIFLEDSPRGSSTAFYAACISAALEHLHERYIVYRDLKPENCMLDEHGYTKLCDMGLARFVLGKSNTLAGTPEYMAPEIIDFPHTHDVAVDWWALGVVSYELLSGQTPFHDEGIAEAQARLLAIRRSQEESLKGSLMFPFHFPSVMKSFVSELLQHRSKRLGASGGAPAVRRHSMFAQLKFDFDACHARSMSSPFSPTWEAPAVVDGSNTFSLENDPELFVALSDYSPGSFCLRQ